MAFFVLCSQSLNDSSLKKFTEREDLPPPKALQFNAYAGFPLQRGT